MAEATINPEEKIFYYGLQSNYDAIETKDPNKLYFCTDTRRIYKGDIEVTETVKFMYSRPANPIPGKIYFFVYSGTTEIYDGEKWIVISGVITTSDEIYSSQLNAGSTTVQFQLPAGNTSVNFFTKNNANYTNSSIVDNNIVLTYPVQAVNDIVYMKVCENSKFCSILVTSFYLDSLVATGNLVFAKGEKFNSAGISVVGNINQESIDLTKYVKTKPSNGEVMDTAGTFPVKITYGVMETTINATVVEHFDEIEVTTLPTKTTYVTGGKLDVSGIVVTAYADNRTISKDVSRSCKYEPEEGTTLVPSTDTVTVKFMDLTTSFNITVENPPATMDQASWEVISQLAEAGTIGDYYPVGSYKILNLQALGSYAIELANINTGTGSAGDYYPAGTAEFVSMHQIYPEQKINKAKTNVGGWEACDARAYLNTTFYNGFPEDLKSVIVPKTHLYNVGGDIDANKELTDNVWIPTFYEMTGYTYSNTNIKCTETSEFNEPYTRYNAPYNPAPLRKKLLNSTYRSYFTSSPAICISENEDYKKNRWMSIGELGSIGSTWTNYSVFPMSIPFAFRLGRK